MKIISSEQGWLALAIGNSRLHWADFNHTTLEFAWNTPHLLPEEIAALANRPDRCWLQDLPELPLPLKQAAKPVGQIILASVVPSQTLLWQTYFPVQVITLDQIPLSGLYSTLGIDRALAVWGARQSQGAPVLVIDGGTALTLTGVDAADRLVGGAILPGLQLQIRSLSQETAALPAVQQLSSLPPRWALNTQAAIRSGVLHTVLAGIREFIQSWWQQFPDSAIALTGGDGQLLLTHLQRYPDLQGRVAIDPHLVLKGIQRIHTQ